MHPYTFSERIEARIQFLISNGFTREDAVQTVAETMGQRLAKLKSEEFDRGDFSRFGQRWFEQDRPPRA